MLKFLVATILFLSIVVINIFTYEDKNCQTHHYYIEKKFDYTPWDKPQRVDPKCLANPNTKFIYLSFDDGPLNGSQNINAIAQKYRVPMNVMVVGEHVEMNKRQKRYFENYKKNPFVEVNNHSYSHASNRYYSFYSNPNKVLEDFHKSMKLLTLNNKIARLPGRNVWAIDNQYHNKYNETKEAVKLLHKNGFQLIGWDIEWKYDRKTKYPIGNSQEFFAQLQHHLESNKKLFTPNNIVVLLHDPMFKTKSKSKELENLIRLLRSQKDYVIVPLSQYPIVSQKSTQKEASTDAPNV